MEEGVFLYSKVLSCCIQGIEGKLVEVEVDLSNGLPQFHIVGLPDSAVRESIERVRAAIKNCGFQFPLQRITVNLAPANLRKEGAAYDLAIAVGILLASQQIQVNHPEHILFIGELSLDGSLRSVPGVLSMVMDAKHHGIQTVILPIDNVHEATLISGIKIVPISHLSELEKGFDHLFNDVNHLDHKSCSLNMKQQDENTIDYADVKGQLHAKRALLVAAAGMHNILLIGPPGSGKTMLIRRLPTILPLLTEEEALEVTKVYSVAQQFHSRAQLICQRPFRSPHHTISQSGLVGGGSIPKPGEISLAHRGVLFLDELPEFNRNVLEVLRQPLEDKHVTIARAQAVFTFPADFMLAASMNPCPCGYLGAESEINTCSCTPDKIKQYRSKVSGPLLDRIDLHVEVPRIDYSSLASTQHHPTSIEMRERIIQCREIQLKRYQGTGIQWNAQLSGKLLQEHCKLDTASQTLLRQAFETIGFSARAYDRILKIARTLADLDESSSIQSHHIAEAIQYRCMDRNL